MKRFNEREKGIWFALKRYCNKIWNFFLLIFSPILGIPVVVSRNGTFGDLMMFNAVAVEYAKKLGKKIGVIVKTNEIAGGLPGVCFVGDGFAIYKTALTMSKFFHHIRVISYDLEQRHENKHLMQRMADKVELDLPDNFRPFLALCRDEINRFSTQRYRDYIVVQSTANSVYTPNKNWIPGRMAEVVRRLKGVMPTIQIGMAEDEPLPVDIHYQGRLTFKESASLLAGARLFVGLEGALMHAAAAFNIPSVIIFGGYIHPKQSGYSNITPIFSDLNCSPCLSRMKCLKNFECMDLISVDQVMEAIHTSLNLK